MVCKTLFLKYGVRVTSEMLDSVMPVGDYTFTYDVAYNALFVCVNITSHLDPTSIALNIAYAMGLSNSIDYRK